MIRLSFTALAALLSVGAAATAQTLNTTDAPRPVLRSEATVNGPTVLNGDLVDNAGIIAKVPIFRAPDLGFTGTVPAEAVVEAVRTHALIGDAFHEAGFPPGVVNVVTNDAADASAVVGALIAHKAVRRVNFTGSTRSNSAAAARWPDTCNTKPNTVLDHCSSLIPSGRSMIFAIRKRSSYQSVI